MEFAGHDFMADGLYRSFGHESLEENLAAFEESTTTSIAELAKRWVAEEQLRGGLPLQQVRGQSFRAVAKMLMSHSYQVWYLRHALQRALLQRGDEWSRSESPAERQGRLDDFFASWKESPRNFHPSGQLPEKALWPSMESTDVGSWKDRASRSRCTATTGASHWESASGNDVPSEEPAMLAARTRRRSSRFSLPPVRSIAAPRPIESAVATVATEKFNYLAIFPHLAKRKPMPTRRLFLTEEASTAGACSSWKIDEILVRRSLPELESVVAPSELSEARRLLDGEEAPVRRASVARSMSISQSNPALLPAQAQEETFLTNVGTPPAKSSKGMARQLMSLPFKDFQDRILKDREPDACDPSPQRLFDRRFRRNLTVLPPATTESRAVLRASNHGLPPLPQKGSNWEPERERPNGASAHSAAYLRTCLSHFVLPELLPFFTGHSKILDAENRQLIDKDVLAMAGVLQHLHPSVINLSNNILLTDQSMVPFLEAVLRQPSGCLLTLQLQRCHVGYNSCVKLASLLESDAAKNLRVLNLNGIALSLAVQVHLAASIREHDKLRELSLADTQLTMECLQNVAENHQLELLDLAWNSIDADAFAALGSCLSNNVSLHSLSLSSCASRPTGSAGAGPPMAHFLECLCGIQNLQNLDISSNQIDHRAALILEDVLASHRHLKKMNVSDNPLGQMGIRSLLRLLADSHCSLRRFECNGCCVNDDGYVDASDQVFRPSCPGGMYQLDLTQPYHRSILRMLSKVAERLTLSPSDAMTSQGAFPVPEKVEGSWVVQTRGTAKFRFNVEKCMGKVATEAKWDFASLLSGVSHLLKRPVPKRKQMQLLLQFWSMRCQISEQILFLNALSKDFLFDAPQVLQLCCEREIAAEVTGRLWHSAPGYLTLLQGSPSLSAYVNVLRRTEQLRNFNPQNPSGHYSLDLANSSDFELGQRLLILDRWEALLRTELKRRDVGRRAGSCIFNEAFDGQELSTGLADWRWHEKGILDLDYATGKRLSEEETQMAEEQFRKLCQALLCSQLPARAKVAALKPASHHFVFSAFQLRALCLQTPFARKELFEVFWPRVVDIQNLKLVLATLDPAHHHDLRWNQCMTFPYIQPEDYDFEFDLKYADHRLACLVVFKLCEAEGWSSVQEPSFVVPETERGDRDVVSDEQGFWRSSKEASLDSMPPRGIFKGRYLGFSRNMKCRRQLLESFGFWPGTSITEDQVCWCTHPDDAPPEIVKLVQWLMLRFPDVTKAFTQIIKKVPGELQVNGSMTLSEFDQALVAFKIRRLDEPGVEVAYRYLASNDTLTQALWKKLEPFVVTSRLNAQDFIGFMRSIAGDIMEDWWQLMAPDSTEVSLAQWTDACRSLGYHGNSALTYQLLEEDGNSISWTDFKQLSRFK